MSTAIVDTDEQVSLPAARRMPGLAVTMPRVVKSEWIKLRTVRSTVITVLGAAAAVIAIGALAASVSAGTVVPPGGRAFGEATDPTGVSMSGVMLAQLVVAVVGVLAISNEYSNGMIRSYFAAVPARLPVLWAKTIVVGVVVSVVSMLATLIAFFVGGSILGSGVTLSDPGVLRAVLGSGLYLGGIAVLAVAVGALLRHTAGSISVLFVSLLLLPNLIGLLLPDSWADSISPYLPTNAGAAFTSVVPAGNLLSVGAGIAVFLGWIVVLIGGAAWRMTHKDA
jgi:ABC-2 type transport system permease protein